MATRLHDVCVALTSMWDAAPALDGVQVVDGPQVNSNPDAAWLFVGHDGDLPGETSAGATAIQDWMAFARTKQELGEVTSAIVAVSGDADTVAVRARALDILSDAEDVLRANNTISGLVMKSHVSEVQVIPSITTDGPKVRVVFTVAYEAEI